ncbi:MAG: AraC family transcriptional regulator [Bacteroidales bacterium]|nr:AraC family transcriptional regulator [Bacteroidales bacterium]
MKRKKKSRVRRRAYRHIDKESLYAGLLRLMTERRLYLDRACCREMLAREMMTNRTYISRVLNLHGQTCQQFINAFRAQHAIGLLARADLAGTPLGDIAVMSGFSGLDAMNRYVKKSAGRTACALRKRLTEKG